MTPALVSSIANIAAAIAILAAIFRFGLLLVVNMVYCPRSYLPRSLWQLAQKAILLA